MDNYWLTWIFLWLTTGSSEQSVDNHMDNHG